MKMKEGDKIAEKEKQLFRMCKFMLILSGLWSQDLKNVSKFYQLIYKCYSLGGQALFSTCLVCFGAAMYLDFGVKISQVLDSFSRMTFVTLIVCKMILVQSKKMQKIINLVIDEEININKSQNKIIKEIYRFHVNYGKKMIFCIVIFLYAAGIINMYGGFYQLYKWKQSIKTLNETIEKPQAIPFWFPFDKNKHYYLAMTYQVCHIVQTLLINGAVQALINSVMVFLRANLKILQYRVRNFDTIFLNNTTKKVSDYKAYRSLRNLVIRHQELIRWVDDFNDSFKNILLLEYCITSMQLATTLIQILEGIKIPFNGTFLMHCLLQLFGLAWNANEILLESSNGLAEAIYDSPWYNQNKQISTSVYFMLMRCKKPLVMSIGPLGVMNVNAAVSRVKLAYSCLSLLQVTTNGETSQ